MQVLGLGWGRICLFEARSCVGQGLQSVFGVAVGCYSFFGCPCHGTSSVECTYTRDPQVRPPASSVFSSSCGPSFAALAGEAVLQLPRARWNASGTIRVRASPALNAPEQRIVVPGVFVGNDTLLSDTTHDMGVLRRNDHAVCACSRRGRVLWHDMA